MKKIDDWEALLKSKEKYESGLPIPGCYISGKIDGVATMVETSYIDLSSLTAMDTSNAVSYTHLTLPTNSLV